MKLSLTVIMLFAITFAKGGDLKDSLKTYNRMLKSEAMKKLKSRSAQGAEIVGEGKEMFQIFQHEIPNEIEPVPQIEPERMMEVLDPPAEAAEMGEEGGASPTRTPPEPVAAPASAPGRVSNLPRGVSTRDYYDDRQATHDRINELRDHLDDAYEDIDVLQDIVTNLQKQAEGQVESHNTLTKQIIALLSSGGFAALIGLATAVINRKRKKKKAEGGEQG